MCLAIPMKIKNMNGCEATCEVGDYVMVHAGKKKKKMTEQQALENIHFLEEIGNAL